MLQHLSSSSLATGMLYPGTSKNLISMLVPEYSLWGLEFLALGVIFSPWKSAVPRGLGTEKGKKKTSRHLYPTLLNGAGGVEWDTGRDSWQGLELSLAAQSLFQIILRYSQANLANSWQSFVSSGCGFGFLLRLRLGTHEVKAGSGTERVGINPWPGFNLDEPWESIPEAWAGSEYLWPLALQSCAPQL